MAERRRRCRYGGDCYRASAGHKDRFSHPGDPDWRDATANADLAAVATVVASTSSATTTTAATVVAMPRGAPAKRKAATATTATSVGIDEVVWAKLKGFPAWPAKVESLASGNTRATVVFFGTSDAATVPVADITAWDAEGGARLAKKSKAKKFAAAIAEAEDASGITLSGTSAAKSKRRKAASPPADSVASPVEATGGDDEQEDEPMQEEGAVPSEGMSAYEQQRLDNIARNEAMLRQLNIQPLPAEAKKPRARAVRGLKSTRRSSEPVVKRERSLRLAGKTPDGSELPPSFKEPTFAEMRFAGDNHNRERIEGELKLADALREEGKGMKRKPKRGEPVIEEEETEEMVAQRKATSASRFASGVGDLAIPAAAEARSAYDEEATLQMLRGLQVKETDVAKVVPERIFSMDFHPSRSKLLVAVGDKWGSIGFFDPDADEEADAVTLFSVHTHSTPTHRCWPRTSAGPHRAQSS